MWTEDAEAAFRGLVDGEPFPAIEFLDARERILTRIPPDLRRYHANLPVEDQTAALLFGLVAAIRPRVVLEAGVADGYSTAVMLAALASSGNGQLHSIDIADDVGVLVEDPARWTLHVVPDDGTTVARIADELGGVDLFFHDCRHSYLGQYRDYDAIWERLRPGGILASDDVNYSWAFVDFCAARGVRPICLLDRRKVSGFVRKPPS
jgi:predicted O-methyltransferase YrrM